MQGDSVPMRIHWPRHADLRINNMVYRPYSRNSATKLGANARDEPASVAVMCPQVPIPAPSSIFPAHSPAEKCVFSPQHESLLECLLWVKGPKTSMFPRRWNPLGVRFPCASP